MTHKSSSQSVDKKVVARIYGKGRGWAFSPSDFVDLGSREAIYTALHRLERKGTIRRVLRGIYDYPRYSELLRETLGPDIDEVARALARKSGWRIQPSGAAALNLVGLSTQVPGRFVYRSDGPSRSFEVGKTTLAFRQGALKEAGFRYPESGVIVQALKALGEDRITDDTIEQLRAWVPEVRRAAVEKDTRKATGWVYATVRRICEERTDG